MNISIIYRNESCIVAVEIEHFIYLVRHWPGEHKLPIELKQSTSSSCIVNRIFCCIWRIFALIFCTLALVSLRAAAFILDDSMSSKTETIWIRSKHLVVDYTIIYIIIEKTYVYCFREKQTHKYYNNLCYTI